MQWTGYVVELKNLRVRLRLELLLCQRGGGVTQGGQKGTEGREDKGGEVISKARDYLTVISGTRGCEVRWRVTHQVSLQCACLQAEGCSRAKRVEMPTVRYRTRAE